MARPDGRLEPGQPLRGAISARAWNRMMDASDIVHGDQFSQSATGPQSGKVPYTWVYCKPNFSVPQWGVVAITGINGEPAATGDAARQFQDMPIVLGAQPAASTTAWGVAVEPIASQAIGRLAVGGVVQIRLADAEKARGSQVLCNTQEWALIRIDPGPVAISFRSGGTWDVGSSRTVEDGYGNLYEAWNFLADLPSPSGGVIQCVNRRWVLASFSLASALNFSAHKQQVLTHSISGNGTLSLEWVDTTNCP